jgi:hypothetical protein
LDDQLKKIGITDYSIEPVTMAETSEDIGTHSIISTVMPTRTFLEKAFLLDEEFQKDNPRHRRMSRHLYDLEKIPKESKNGYSPSGRNQSTYRYSPYRNGSIIFP